MVQVSLSTSTTFDGDLNALVEDQGTSLTIRFDLDAPAPAGGLKVYIDSDIVQIVNRLDLPSAIANPQFENLNLLATQTNLDNSGLAVQITEGSTFGTVTLNIFDNDEPEPTLPETFDGLVEATFSLLTADQVAAEDQEAITGVSDYTIDPSASTSTVLFADDASQLPTDPPPPTGGYDEATDGEISGDPADPLDFALAEGTTRLSATTGGGEQEYVTVTVPEGLQLDSLVLESYSAGGDVAFIGVQEGEAFTEPLDNSADTGNLLGYALFGGSEVDTNILDNIGGGDGAIGFGGPLASGTYTFALQQLGTGSDYTLAFNVAAAAPVSDALQVSLYTGPNYLIEDEGTVSAHAFLVTNGVIPESGLVVSVDASNLSEFDLASLSVEGGEIVAARDDGFDLLMTEYTTLVNLPIADDGETETGETASFTLATGDGYEVVESLSGGSFNLVDTRDDIPTGDIAEGNDVIPFATDTRITADSPTFSAENTFSFDIGNRYLNDDGSYTYIDASENVNVFKVDLQAGETITVETFEVEGSAQLFGEGFIPQTRIFNADGSPATDFGVNGYTKPAAPDKLFGGLTNDSPEETDTYQEFTAPTDGSYYVALGVEANVFSFFDDPDNDFGLPEYNPLEPGFGSGANDLFGGYSVEINLITDDNPRNVGTPTPPVSNPDVTNPPTLSLSALPTTTDADGNFTNAVVEHVDVGGTSSVNFTITADGEIPEGGIEFVLNSSANLFDYVSFSGQSTLPSTIGGQSLGAFYNEDGIPTGIRLRIEEPTMTVTYEAANNSDFFLEDIGDVIPTFEPLETDGAEDVTFFLQPGEGYIIAPDAGSTDVTYYDSVADVPPSSGGGNDLTVVGVTVSETELIESEQTETTVTFNLSEAPPAEGLLVYLDSANDAIVGSILSQFDVLNAQVTGGNFPVPNGDNSGFFFTVTEQTASITLAVFDELTVPDIDASAVQEGLFAIDFELQSLPTYAIDPDASGFGVTIADSPDSRTLVTLAGSPDTLIESEGTVSEHTFSVSSPLPTDGLTVSVDAPNLDEFNLDAIEVEGGTIAAVTTDGFDLTLTEQSVTVSLPVLDDGVAEDSETATFTLQPGDTYEVAEGALEASFTIVDNVGQVSTPEEVEINDTIADANALGLSLESPQTSVTARIGRSFTDLPEDVDIYSFDLEAGQTISLDIDTEGVFPTQDGVGPDLAGSPVPPELETVLQTPDTELRVFDADGNELAANTDGAAPDEEFSRDPYLEFTAEETGTYYVGVSQLGNRNYDPNVERSGSGWVFPEAGVFFGPYELTAALEGVNFITPIADEFEASYSTLSLGQVPLDTGDFVPGGYGGIAFLDDDTLLVTGNAYSSEAAIYEVDVTRDAETGSITGYAGPATFVANAPGINITNPNVDTDPDIEVGGLDGGLIVAPNGTLLYTTYFDNSIGQILPGNTDPELDAFIDLTALGIDPPSTGALTIVPEGFPGEGRLKITSYDNGNFYDALLVENADGTYDVTLEGSVDLIPDEDGDSRGLEGPVYVDESYSNFTTDSVLISQFDTNTINAFEVDELGNPILETERVFLDGLTGSGASFLFGFIADPVTGDFVASLDPAFTTDGEAQGGRLLIITDEAPPTAVEDTDPFDNVTELDISGGQAIASGTVSTSNNVYAIEATAGDLLSIEVDVTEVLNGIAYTNDDTQLYLYNEAGDVLAFSDDKPDSFASNLFNYLVEETGTYYAAVTTAGNEPILELGQVNQLLGFEETGLANVAYDITVDAQAVPETARLFDIARESAPDSPVGNVLIDGDEVLFIDLNGTRNTDVTGSLTIEVNAEEVNAPENTLDNTLVFEDTLSFGLDVFDFILDFDEPFASTDLDDIIDSLDSSGITAIIPPDELIQRVVFTEQPVPGNDNKINFESGSGEILKAGDVITDQIEGLTVEVEDALDAMIFDTASWSGGDYDLRSDTLGNVLIISEDGDSADPDDNIDGGTLMFDWDGTVNIASLGLLDIEESGGTITLYGADDTTVLSTIEIPALGDSSLQSIDIGTADVGKMNVMLAGSGAITEIVLAEDSSIG
ncbi:MAG: PPC domain-containing protein [Cyanobacteria bacterium P01_F01_bin.150]